MNNAYASLLDRTFIGPAQIWKRGLAFFLDLAIIDFFLLGPFKSVVASVVGNKSFSDTYTLLSNNPTQADGFIWMFFIIAIISMFYFVFSEYLTGQTPGKMFFRLFAVSEGDDTSYRRPSFAQCLLRSSYLIPVIPFILLVVIDPIFLIFSKKHQRLSEWLSKTQVVERFNY